MCTRLTHHVLRSITEDNLSRIRAKQNINVRNYRNYTYEHILLLSNEHCTLLSLLYITKLTGTKLTSEETVLNGKQKQFKESTSSTREWRTWIEDWNEDLISAADMERGHRVNGSLDPCLIGIVLYRLHLNADFDDIALTGSILPLDNRRDKRKTRRQI